MPEISPLIRLFVSSTFSDFAFEREVLQRAVFPRLRALCAAHGCRFQPIDLRWGVSEEAGNEKRTLAICLDEIARCQSLSPDLNFLIFLGDRYGSCFLPERISSDLVARLFPYLAPAMRDTFAQAYREDLNALRPEHVLLPSNGAGYARQAEEALRVALAQAARTAGFSEHELLPFVASATHLEIQRGLLAAEADSAAVVCALRSFTPTPSGNDAHGYVEQDRARNVQVESLKHAVEGRLKGHLHRYAVPWAESGPVFDHETLARQLLDLLEPRVREALARRQATAQTRNPTSEANSQFAAARASVLVGRENALATVAAYLSKQLPFPLVVTGASGVGKSTLLARAVQDATSMHPNAVVVTRYIGVTPGTSSLADLLTNLLREIAERYGRPEPEPMGDLSQLVAAVSTQLEMQPSPADRPLFVVLDALDQLGTPRQRVDWLPPTLAPNVHVVVSILSDRPELENLRALLPEERGLRLDPLTRAQGAEVLRRWLATEERRLTPIQEAAVLDGFALTPESSGAPLYLRLAFEQARTWRSFDPVKPLPRTVPALIQAYFEELEEPGRHGRELVAYALGDLAAAKHGLAEDELLDVLPQSEVVREGLRRVSPNSPPIDAQQPLPMVLWARLAADLDRYLTEREADEARLVTFYHRQVRAEAERRYLGGSNGAARHADLSAYFDHQPYQLGESGASVWNRRKLAELAYQQSEAGRELRLASEATLTDGRFLEGKLTVEGVAATLDDLSLRSDDQDIKKIARAVRAGAIQLARNPAELQNQITGRVGQVPRLHDLPSRTGPWLRLKSHSLLADPALLHLLQGHTSDISSCALNGDGTLAFSSSADGTLRLWDTTSGETLRIMDGFGLGGPGVTSCALSADGRIALAAAGKSLRVWHTNNGDSSIFRGHTDQINSCAVNADGTIALSASSDHTLRIWNIRSGETVRVLQGHTGEVTHCAISADGKRALSASGKAAISSAIDHTLRLWDLDSGRTLRRWKVSKITELASCALSADGHRVFAVSNLLGGVLGRSTLRVWDASSGRTMRTLKGFKGIVASCALSADGGIALSGSRTAYLSTAMGDQARKSCLVALLGAFWVFDNFEGSTLRLWDTKAGKTLRILLGHKDTVELCALSADGHRAISASSNVVNDVQLADPSEHFALRVWDTACVEPQLVREPFAGPITGCALNADGRYALSFAKSDKTLRVWDTSTGQLLQRLEHKQSVISCALSADGRLALSTSYDARLRLWDTIGGKLLHTWLFPILTEVSDCALSADGRQALSARMAGLSAWDTISGKPLYEFLTDSDDDTFTSNVTKMWMRGFAMSQDGEFALIVPKERAPQLWDIKRSHMLLTLAGDTDNADSWVLSADGQWVLSAFLDGRLQLWDTSSGQLSLTLTGHASGIPSCALSATGRLAISASLDRTLRLWNTLSGTELARWTHDTPLCRCALSADGRMAMAGDIDGGLHVLQIVGVGSAEEALVSVPRPSWLASRRSRTRPS